MDLSELPKVDHLAGELARTCDLPDVVLVEIARQSIASARERVLLGEAPDAAAQARAAVEVLEAVRPVRVVNATGVLLHTNLGRAPWPGGAVAAATQQTTGFGNVEIDGSGTRSRRGEYARRLLAATTGAEAGLVVNNNAGALLLALTALGGRGGRVAVSRGELIEIGGSFRLPELIESGGLRLVEVGTTNRTRTADYDRAAHHADVILKVHPSNYRIEGFAEEVAWGDLAALAADHGVPFVADVGSGLLDAGVPWLDTTPAWLRGEPAIRQTVATGASVVLASGDKLLGGPQAGLAAGRATAIAAMASHPLARALRCDGSTLAAVAATLEVYATGRGAEIPFWTMAAMEDAVLRERCADVIAAAGTGTVADGTAVAGAGSVPGAGIPTPVVSLGPEAWERLARHAPMVLATRRDEHTIVNLRTVDPADDALIAGALRS